MIIFNTPNNRCLAHGGSHFGATNCDLCLEQLTTVKSDSPKQPMPTPGASPVFPRVLGYLFDRILYGVKEYGRPLETHNGRSCLKDAIEEALDLPVYLTQLEMELESALTAIQTGNPAEAVAILRTILGKDKA